eukprot:snap_masked-scaffold_22-processed-gene-5.27-mRNA-1 protein AED:1.00 eAED:1.00 QI:0/0/0/0/1/1/2/0/209
MSYFHRIPSNTKLRDEAMTKAESFFEEQGLSISSLSLKEIILPEKRPLKHFPTQNIIRVNFDTIRDTCSENRCSSGRLHCSSECPVLSVVLLIAPCALCCNIGGLIDESLQYSISFRLDLVRLILLFYSEGVFIYRRKIEAFKSRYCCFCAHSIDGDYDEYSQYMYFTTWDQIEFSSEPYSLGEGSSPSIFVSFFLGKHFVPKELFMTD